MIFFLAGRMTVGRRAERDVALPWDTEVSRLHAQLELIGSDWIVVDDGLAQRHLRQRRARQRPQVPR